MYRISKRAGLTKFKPHSPRAGMGLDEPPIPRIPAAPTIAGCVKSLVDLDAGIIHYVYEIQTEPDVDNEGVINWPCPEEQKIDDAEDTGEVWYLTPVKCKCIGTVDFFGKFTRG